jgi:SAM-dependent methyltransferase
LTGKIEEAGFESILSDVARYYGSRLSEHGATARGVDWNGTDSQYLRFEQLAKVLPAAASTGELTFSVKDVGCGYGAMFDYLSERFPGLDYLGTDISPEMIAVAKDRYQDRSNAKFTADVTADHVTDFSVASGIFNVRLNHGVDEWQAYVEATLEMMARSSRLGFSFNSLTAYSDKDRMRGDLHYADPCALFDLCKRRYSRHVALLHDYGLYEFTIIVRKEV